MRLRHATDIAEWFVAWAEEMDADISQLKLQKLLYYAQGKSIALTGNRLFPERIEAWQHGPVVPEVYRQTKRYGRSPIDPDEFISDDFNWDEYSDIENMLVAVWREYGIYSAWALREKTHSEKPWIEAFSEGPNIEITDAALKEFFGAH